MAPRVVNEEMIQSLTVSRVLRCRRRYGGDGNRLAVSPVRRLLLHRDAFRCLARPRRQFAGPGKGKRDF